MKLPRKYKRMTPNQPTQQQIHIPPAMYIISETNQHKRTTQIQQSHSPSPAQRLFRLCSSSVSTTRRQMSLAKTHFTRNQTRTRPFMKSPGIAQFTILPSDHRSNLIDGSWDREFERRTGRGRGPARWWDIRCFDGLVYDRWNKFRLEDNLWWNDLVPYTSHNTSMFPMDTTTPH